MAIGLLQILNTKKYGELMTVIRYQFAFDIDMYPKTINSAYELMQNHSVSKKGEMFVATTTETKTKTETVVGEDENTGGEKYTDNITSLVCNTLKRERSYQALKVGKRHESPALGVRKRDILPTSTRTSKR